MARPDRITPDHIRNPIEWACDQIWLAALTVGSLGRSLEGSPASRESSLPEVRQIKVADLRDVLVRGLEDFGAYRTDVIFLCLVYPLAGLALSLADFRLRIIAAAVSTGIRLRANRPRRGGGPL